MHVTDARFSTGSLIFGSSFHIVMILMPSGMRIAMSEPDTKSRTLSDWLNWLERIHPKTIEMGLDRINRVKADLNLVPAPFPSSRSVALMAKGRRVP